MSNVTLGKRVIARPVRVRSHAGVFIGDGPFDTELTVPGYEGIVMDRNDAHKFLGIPHPRQDRKTGQVTPKALTYECEVCATPYPPKTHPCFQGTIAAAGLVDEPVPCDLCGDPVDKQADMGNHFDTKHKGVRRADKKSANEEKIAALEAQIKVLMELVAKQTSNEHIAKSPTPGKKNIHIPNDLSKLAEEVLGD